MKTRIIQTRFWEDSLINELEPKFKLLFIYLITNKRIELTGIYELPITYIAMETGLTVSEVQKGFEKISSKISYSKGYVIIKNHKKYQDYSKGSEKQRAAFQREFDLLPESVKTAFSSESGTSSQLVQDQFETSPELDIIHKEEIRNKKTEIKKGENLELQEIKDFYNLVFEKTVTSVKGFESNYLFWSKIHDLEKIKLAITKAKTDSFWKDKMNLQILFRRKNQRGEDVDYIEELANRVQSSNNSNPLAAKGEPGKYSNLKKTVINNEQ